MAQPNDRKSTEAEQAKITDAGAVELDESAIDQMVGGAVPPLQAQPASLIAKAPSGKF